KIMTEPTETPVAALALEYETPPLRPIHPWRFVPTLYFMQALPYILVIETFGTAYKSLGIDNLQIALWTGLASLPWTFKMFWAPLVELNSTRRRWTVIMQVLLSALIGASAIAMTSSAF